MKEDENPFDKLPIKSRIFYKLLKRNSLFCPKEGEYVPSPLVRCREKLNRTLRTGQKRLAFVQMTKNKHE